VTMQQHQSADARSDGPGGDEAQEDEALVRVVDEEERVLGRVHRVLDARRGEERKTGTNYEQELLSLRDQINDARLEDVPPLIEEMERLQGVAARRAKVAEGYVDPRSPYFGRLVLEEGTRKREVLIGRGTYLDPKTGVRIVDWRDAPVSRLYYRYEEGDDYEENFGGRDVNGDILTRRSLAIVDGKLRRIGSPQGTFLKRSSGEWLRAGDSATRLSGGQGVAMRPESHHRPGKLGVGTDEEAREDKHLPEITALIDPRQFDLITKPGSGLVVIQGGAGSGKTTIGLHRMAYLAFQDAQRFRADKMLIVVFNDALARYIGHVLPALGVPGVPVLTYEKWAHRQRVAHVHGLPRAYADDTPGIAIRVKKHPAMLRLVDAYAERTTGGVEADLAALLENPGLRAARDVADRVAERPVASRLEHLRRFVRDPKASGRLDPAMRHRLERTVDEGRRALRDVVGAWAELLTDLPALRAGFAEHAPGVFTDEELREAHSWCVRQVGLALAFREAGAAAGEVGNRRRGGADADARRRDDRRRGGGDEDDGPMAGIDGRFDDEVEQATLDREDDTILLRLVQRLRGALGRREPLRYEHLFVDEAQDLSPVELSVLLETTTRRRSVTLAGDTAQRLHMDNGFSDWRGVLEDLGMAHVQIEPLRLTYRSTHEIMAFAANVLGDLGAGRDWEAPRRGAPVELFRFSHSGDAVGYLAEALRELGQSEPRASVAVIARYPEQAETYFRGLRNAEVPNLRHIADQDFPFRPGIDVTDIRQVKGLEFDYVVLVEASRASYPDSPETRHLLHIGATRAAHQLWVVTTGEPSTLLPEALRERGY